MSELVIGTANDMSIIIMIRENIHFSFLLFTRFSKSIIINNGSTQINCQWHNILFFWEQINTSIHIRFRKKNCTCHFVNKYLSSANHFLNPPSGYFSDTFSRPELPFFIRGFVDPQQMATSINPKS